MQCFKYKVIQLYTHCCSVTKLCLTLWGPMDCSMPGFPVHHQIPELIQIYIHRVGDAIQPSHSTVTGAELTQGKKVLYLCTQHHFGHVQLFATLWTVACQASVSTGSSRQEYWSVLASTDCQTILKHYTSGCPSYQLP